MPTFSAETMKLTQAYKRRMNKIIVDSRKEISRRIYERTPVQDGDARRNWKAEGLTSETYTFFNDMRVIPYIRRLEYGRTKAGRPWSPQLLANGPPYGMVRVSVAEWPDIVDAIARMNAK